MTDLIPRVILPPEAGVSLKSGFDQLARVLQATMGPTRGLVMHSTELKPAPEPITDAATIARRITSLPDRRQNVGAMLLRNLVWRVHKRTGDYGAITAVLSQAILDRASRYVSSGASAVRVQAGIQKAARQVAVLLQDMAVPVESLEQRVNVIFSVTQEPALSFIIGEMTDILGDRAHIEIQNYMAPYLEREYIRGGKWSAKLISPLLINDAAGGKAVCRDCQVVLFNGSLSEKDDVLPLIKILATSERKNLLLVAQKITGEALNTLVAVSVQNRNRLKFVLVDLLRAGSNAQVDLQDLSLLTGAKLFEPQAGDRLDGIHPEDMGCAERGEANSEFLVVSTNGGNPVALEDSILGLIARLEELDMKDAERDELELRLGRLAGCSGVLKIGAHHKNEREILHQKAEKGLCAMRALRKGGILPGAGTSFLHCISQIEKMDCPDEDERLGYKAVAYALRRPFEQLLQNAAVSETALLAHTIMNSAPGLVYDIRQRKILPAQEAGVYDLAHSLVVALETASSGAQMALSTDVLVLKRNPRISFET